MEPFEIAGCGRGSLGGRDQFTDVMMLCDAEAAAAFPNAMALKRLQDRMNLSFYKPSYTTEEYPCAIDSAQRTGNQISATGTCAIPELAETQRFVHEGVVSTDGFDLRVKRAMEYGVPASDAEIAEKRKAKLEPVVDFSVTGSWVKDC